MGTRDCRLCGGALILWAPPEWADLEPWWLCSECDMPDGPTLDELRRIGGVMGTEPNPWGSKLLSRRCVCKHRTLDHDQLGCELCQCHRPLGHPDLRLVASTIPHLPGDQEVA